MEKAQMEALKNELTEASTSAKKEIAQSLGYELPKNLADTVLNSILSNVQSGRAKLPQNYDVGNAIKVAYYVLGNAKTKDNKPVLTGCSTASIANSLLYMAVKGLDPSKDQVYFIPYGGKLTAMPSYFGNMLMVKRLKGYESDPVATIIYEGDEVEMEHTVLGEEFIKSHTTNFKNKTSKKYLGAYATIIFDGKLRSCVMTMEDIKESWSMSKTNKEHKTFTTEFMKRTILNRLLKPILKSSDDSNLFVEDTVSDFDKDNVVEEVVIDEESFNETAEETTEVPVETVIVKGQVVEKDTGEVLGTVKEGKQTSLDIDNKAGF